MRPADDPESRLTQPADPDASAAVADRYARFARDEAPGRSALYAEWADGVAADADVVAVLARIPASSRQPPLVFAVSRLLGSPVEGYPAWRAWVLGHADALVAECTARRLQTNEPLRCAAMLPALSLIDGPIALLEVGASAGLCLYPDRYSYRYATDDEIIALDPADGRSTVVLSSELRGTGRPALAMPEIVWRAGIDLDPLDARSPADRAWLTTLVWPGESARAHRIRAALDIVAADPPRIVRGDAADLLAEVADEAPRDATLVITTPGVLVHVPRQGRDRIIDAARSAGRWITLDAPATHRAWHPIDAAGLPDGAFALALDGQVLAAADPLGAFVEWRASGSAPRR
jgi:hypothetical protein